MTKLVVPNDPDGLLELMKNKGKLKDIFGDPTTMAEFQTNWANNFAKKNPDTITDLRDQIQSTVFDMIRSNSGGRAPVNLGTNFQGGKPVLTLDGQAAVSHGKGAVYNKWSPGAQLEEKVKADDRFTSFGEYCQAINELRNPSTRANREGLINRLQSIREFQNSFSSEEPGAGGFLIPEDMRSQLLQLSLEKGIVRPLATVIPMSTLRVPIPMVDDTSHVSTVFGGVTFYWTEEAASLTESTATFGRVVLDAKKLTGFFKVPAELLDDAPAFSAWFDTIVPVGLAFAEDIAFMTETGVSTPQGFINSPASVSVAKQTGQTAATIVWENIVGMYARMLPASIPNSVWIASIDCFPQLATMALSVGTGGGPVWIGGYGNSGGMSTPPMTILGRPVIFTEKTSVLGTTGDINFVDLAYYLIGDRQAVRVDSSEHFLFQNNQMAYRIIERVDGRPWLQSALTPHNNSASTLSAFVQLATRS